jgi:uncharacterized phage protein (TIGR01671 family)
MRTIKFRAWDESIRRMCEVVSLDFRSNQARVRWYESETKQGEYYELLHSDNLILMQFTGLVDKDGKEIYEGDIITIDSEFDKKHYKGNVYWNWKLGMFRMKSFDRESFFGVLLTQPHYEAKVIGNIFQNPELLKEAK